MDHAKYEAIKAARLTKDRVKRQGKMGGSGHLARKIAAKRKYFKQKRKAVDRNFEGRKNAKINREHGRWNRKSAKWASKGSKWDRKWNSRAVKFNSRMGKRFD